MSEDKKEKKQNKKTRTERARKKRIALAEEKGIVKKDNSNAREDFRKYFLKLKKKKSLDKSLEEVLWVHLKTIKHDKKELFDEGIKHFGYDV